MAFVSVRGGTSTEQKRAGSDYLGPPERHGRRGEKQCLYELRDGAGAAWSPRSGIIPVVDTERGNVQACAGLRESARLQGDIGRCHAFGLLIQVRDENTNVPVALHFNLDRRRATWLPT